MKRAWLLLLPLPLLAGALLYLAMKKRKLRTVTGADGRTFRQISPATLAGDGSGSPSIWVPVPPDGRQYFPDLGYDLGQSTAPPMMKSFGA